MTDFHTGQVVRRDKRPGTYYVVLGHTPRGRVKLVSYHAPGIRYAVWPDELSGTEYNDVDPDSHR